MTDQDLIKRIKNLKKINPSQEWMSFARHNLVNRVKLSDNANQETNLGFWGWMKQFQAAALVGCLLLNILVGPWLIAKASQSSLPGDLLYAIKKVTESVQTRVASEENAIELQVEFANRRLEELNKVAQQYATKVETQKIVADFKDNLAGASQHLNNISKEKAVIVAKQTKKINEDLIKAKEDAPDEIKEELAEAEKAIEDIKFQILAVLTEGENDDIVATSSDEEILIYLKGETATSSEDQIK